MDEYSYNEKTDDKEIDIIDISKAYTFAEFMTKINKNKRKVFYSNGQLYFMKDDTLKKTCKGLKELLTPACEDVKLTTELLNQRFYNTNITINHIVSKINHEDIIKFLNDNYTLIHVDEDNYYSMTISKEEDNSISYCITDLDNNILDPDFCYEHYELITSILFDSFLNGTWFILDNKED